MAMETDITTTNITTTDLLLLDHAGFLAAPGMSEAEFVSNARQILETHRRFDESLEQEGSAGVFDIVTVTPQDRIAPEIIDEAAGITENLYGFSVRHVPGFYLTRAVGLLWGGCMLGDQDEHFSVMLLRDAFKKRRRFLSYTRDELLAHELCHSVRQSLAEISLEEYFAYRCSRSPIRRYLGNCFIRDIDALLFVIPIMFLPAVELLRAFLLPGLPVWPFWILAMLYPAFLLIRNALSRRIVSRAREALTSCGAAKVEAILFRSTPGEMKQISGFRGEPDKFRKWAEELAKTELRWQIILRRFVDKDELTTVDMKESDNNENC